MRYPSWAAYLLWGTFSVRRRTQPRCMSKVLRSLLETPNDTALVGKGAIFVAVDDVKVFAHDRDGAAMAHADATHGVELLC
ncbi:hypothetical protein CUR178_05261 [Leishmania enriettii]|uniref:Uncharacterized protein n=1 Tax=Leishmania enriettii TaxID=5663 RepID=A0A836GLX6_LEIEN|nr:hypothetical protein CUR178_05261 [Leishmania enriettii]